MSSQTFSTLTLTTENQVTTVTLNRPEKKNAMSFTMMRELIKVANLVKKDHTTRAVILTGVGDDFCSGIDLSDLNQPKNQAFALWELVKPWQNMFQRVNLCWLDVPVPVIAVINGHCIGAGLQLALACDIRIAAFDSKLSIMEAKWGLVPDMGLTQSALGLTTVDVLKELAMSARIVNGVDAKRLGLITHVNENPLEHATTLIDELKTRSPDAVLASKRLINRMYKQSACTLYYEKIWQTKLLLGRNRKLAMKKSKDSTVEFVKRQFQ